MLQELSVKHKTGKRNHKSGCCYSREYDESAEITGKDFCFM